MEEDLKKIQLETTKQPQMPKIQNSDAVVKYVGIAGIVVVVLLVLLGIMLLPLRNVIPAWHSSSNLSVNFAPVPDLQHLHYPHDQPYVTDQPIVTHAESPQTMPIAFQWLKLPRVLGLSTRSWRNAMIRFRTGLSNRRIASSAANSL